MLGEGEIGDTRLFRMRGKPAPAAFPLCACRYARWYDLTQRVDRIARGVRVCVGPEVTCPLPMTLSCVFDGRKDIRLGNCNVRVALVIFEVNVEVWVILVDEVALEHERLMLAADNDIVKRTHDLHHKGDLGTLVLQGCVLPHARAQVLGLAYIDDLAVPIFPEIASGVGRNLLHLLGKRDCSVSFAVRIPHDFLTVPRSRLSRDAHGSLFSAPAP